MQGKLFVISAPSGTGKTSLVNKLLELYSYSSLSRVVTYTTKNPRKSDTQGIDYFFISQEEFIKKIEHGFFLEWSNIYGAYYGSPKSILDEVKLGKSYIIILDRQGACNVKSWYKEAILIWIEPPNIKALFDRLCKRATETEDQILYRIKLAKEEIESERVEKVFNYNLINKDFNQTLEQLALIINYELDNLN